MAAAWDGPEGDDWTRRAVRYDAASRAYDRYLLDAAQIGSSDPVLDVGCGCGISTLDAASRTTGDVLGIDLSARMIEHARERAAEAGRGNARFQCGDAQVFDFAPGAFAVAISRFGGMFFADPVAAFRNVGRALRPDGRLALLAWRTLADNEWVRTIRDALAAGRTLPPPPPGMPGPFGLADRDATARILGDAGFARIELTPVDEPMYLGADADDAFEFVRGLGMARKLLEPLDDTTRITALAELRARFAQRATPAGVLVGAGAWLVKAKRA